MKRLITILFIKAVPIIFIILPLSVAPCTAIVTSGHISVHPLASISNIVFPENEIQNNDSIINKQHAIKITEYTHSKLFSFSNTRKFLPHAYFYKNPLVSVAENNSPYQFSLPRELPIIGASTGILAGAFIIHKQKPTLSAYQLDELDHTKVWAFDRGATYHYSPTIDLIGDVFLYTSVVLPGLYLIDNQTKADFGKILFIQAETGLAVLAVTAFTKAVTHRSRPYAYHPLPSVDQKTSLKTTSSFFSGHTSVSAAMSYFTASTFAAYHPDSQLKPFVWAYAATWPAVTGYLRYRAGYHYPTDILVGYVVGAATGIIVPKIHKAVTKKMSKRKPAF